MKKALMAKIISLSAVALIVSAILVISIVNPSLLASMHIYLGNTYAYDENGYSVGEAELDDKISNITVDWISGSVKMTATDGDLVTLSEDDALSDEYKLRYKVTNGTLDIRYIKSGESTSKCPQKNLIIGIPKKIANAMDDIELDLASSQVDMSGITALGIDIDTASGSVSADNITADTFEISAASAVADLKNVIIDEFSCDTASGDVSISGDVKKIDFDAASADLIVDLADTLKKLDADTASGDINLTLPKSIKGFNATIDTASGDIESDFEGTLIGKDSFVFGEEGNCTISADTASGNLTIHRK